MEAAWTAATSPRWRRGVALARRPRGALGASRLCAAGRGARRLSVTFAEGRYREVKRYCEALGHPVMRLRRVQFGPLRLGDAARRGARAR